MSRLPPYNDHLMRDVGAATLGWVLMIFFAALTLRPVLVRLALALYERSLHPAGADQR